MQDRHTRAVRPERRRLHIEVAAETRDAIDRYAGKRGLTLGRALDEIMKAKGGWA
jgi:hypothetical protein